MATVQQIVEQQQKKINSMQSRWIRIKIMRNVEKLRK